MASLSRKERYRMKRRHKRRIAERVSLQMMNQVCTACAMNPLTGHHPAAIAIKRGCPVCEKCLKQKMYKR